MRTIDPPDLRKLHIYLTDRCNASCRHCWVNAGPTKGRHLGALQANEQINMAMPLGLEVVKVTGGEPFLFQHDMLSILGHSSHNGLETRLETNASLVNCENASILNSLGVIVYVSLDGSRPGIHDTFRNRNGGFREVIAGIQTLVEEQVRVNVISCIHSGNIRDIDPIISLCAKLGVDSVKFNFPSTYGRARGMKRGSELLTTSQIVEITRSIDDTYHGCGLDIDVDVPRVFRIHPNPGFRCEVLNTLSILPDGTYSLCGIGVTHSELAFGNMHRDGLERVWKGNDILIAMRESVPKSGKGVCELCTEYEQCYTHCLAYSVSEFASLNGPHPLCQSAFEEGLFPKEKLRDASC